MWITFFSHLISENKQKIRLESLPCANTKRIKPLIVNVLVKELKKTVLKMWSLQTLNKVIHIEMINYFTVTILDATLTFQP